MAYEFKVTRRVEFAETDMAGIVHFTNFFRYMEAAEHAFLRSLGLSVHAEEEAGRVRSWPRVHAACDYHKPLRFEDTLEVHLLVARRSEKSLTYHFVFRRLGEHPAEVARGAMTVVHTVRDGPAAPMHAAPIPPEIAQKIEPAPPALLEEETHRHAHRKHHPQG